jgi:hypothetical protein
VVRQRETAHFVVYDKRSGQILAVHHVTALPGVSAPSDDVVTRRVRACAAEALGRASTDLAVLATPRPPVISPGVRVDTATGRLTRPERRSTSETDEVAAGRRGDAIPLAVDGLTRVPHRPGRAGSQLDNVDRGTSAASPRRAPP